MWDPARVHTDTLRHISREHLNTVGVLESVTEEQVSTFLRHL